jgi:hypothetical protein
MSENLIGFFYLITMGDLVRKLGTEKSVDLMKDFDLIVDKYRKIADASGYHGELKFQKEGGFTVVFVEIKTNDNTER